MTAVVAIVPTTIALLDCEEQSAAVLAAALGIRAPCEWPPEFNGEHYRRWQRSLLSAQPDEPGYAGYYLVGDGELVGICGYKGPPGKDGAVEIGYSIVGPRRRRGYASAAVAQLVARAFADPRVAVVIGETLAEGLASQGVLRRCGFASTGTRLVDGDDEVMRFELRRQE